MSREIKKPIHRRGWFWWLIALLALLAYSAWTGTSAPGPVNLLVNIQQSVQGTEYPRRLSPEPVERIEEATNAPLKTASPEPAPENRADAPQPEEPAEDVVYVLNTSRKKFHDPGCSSVEQIKRTNRQDYTGSREVLLEWGYTPCGRCKP